jgi:hypothetical protein
MTEMRRGHSAWLHKFSTAAEKALSVEFDHQHLTTAEERSSFVTYLLGDDKDMSSRERPFLWKTAHETSDNDDMNLAVVQPCHIMFQVAN